MLHYDGRAWRRVSSGSERDLNAVSGASDRILWIAGDQGTLLRHDGRAFAPVASGTDTDLEDLWVDAGGAVVAVGRGGAILRRL